MKQVAVNEQDEIDKVREHITVSLKKSIDLIVGSLDQAIARVDALNQFTTVMTNMGFASDQVQRSIDQLTIGIANVPTSLDSMMQGTQKMASVTGDLDVATITTLALNNAFLASGTSIDVAEKGIAQYTNMLAQGTVSATDWTALQQTMGLALDKTAQAFGFTGKAAKEELYQALEQGHISFETFNDKLLELNQGVGGFAVTAQENSRGIQNAWQQMKDGIVDGLATIILAIQDVSSQTSLQSIEHVLLMVGSAFNIVLNAIAAGIPIIMNFIQPILPLIEAIVIGIGAVTLALGIFESATILLLKVLNIWKLLQATLLFNPWSLAAMAAVAAVILIIEYWEPITAFFTTLWSTILNSTNQTMMAIVNFVTDVVETITTSFSSAVEAIKNGFVFVQEFVSLEQVINGVKLAVITLGGALLTYFLGPLGMLISVLVKVIAQTTLVQDIFKVLKGEMTISEVVDNLISSLENLISGLGENIGQIAIFGAQIITALVEGLSNGITILVANLEDIIAIIVSTLLQIMPQLITVAAIVITALAEGLSQALPMLATLIAEILPLIITFITESLHLFIEVGTQLLLALIEGLVMGIESFVGTFVVIQTALIEAIMTMLPILIEAGLQIVQALLDGIIIALPFIIEAALNIVLMLVEAIIQALPVLIEVGLTILMTLIEAILQALPVLIEAAVMIILALVGALIAALPQIIAAGIQLIMGLIQGIIEVLPQLIAAGIMLIEALVNAVIVLVPALLEAGITLITALIAGVIQLLPELIAAGAKLIMALLTAILKLVPTLLSAGITLIVALVSGILSIIGQVIAAGASLITGLIRKILSFVGQLLSAGVTLVGNLVSGLLSVIHTIIAAGVQIVTSFIDKIVSIGKRLLEIGKGLVTNLVDGIVSVVSKMKTVGSDLVKGLIQGITNMKEAAIEAITGVVDGVINKAKSLLGIKSPSRVFKQIGAWVAEGWTNGIAENGSKVSQAVQAIAEASLAIANQYRQQEQSIMQKHEAEKAKIQQQSAQDIAKIERTAANNRRQLTMEEQQQIQSIKAAADKQLLQLTTRTNQALAQLEKQMNQERITYANEYIEEKRKLGELTIADEARLWNAMYRSMSVGTEEYEQAYQNHQRTVKQIREDMAKLEESYVQKIKTINDQLTTDIAKANEVYDKALAQRMTTLQNFVGFFDEFKEKTAITGQELITNAQGQVDALKDYRVVMESLWSRVGNQAFMKELEAMGPKVLGELKALNGLSDEELQKYVALYQEKFMLATTQAEYELTSLKTSTQTNIIAMQEIASIELDKLHKQWQWDIQNIIYGTAQAFDSMVNIGRDAGQGLYDGLASMESSLISKAEAIANAIKSTIQSALDIHSPSRWMRDFIAGNMAQGFASGVHKYQNTLTNASAHMAEYLSPDVTSILRDFKPSFERELLVPHQQASYTTSSNHDNSRKMHNTIYVQSHDDQRIQELERTLQRLAFGF